MVVLAVSVMLKGVDRIGGPKVIVPFDNVTALFEYTLIALIIRSVD